MVIVPRHTRHPASISATRITQFSQKRACPHGTNANPSHGAVRHTSQNCDSVTAKTKGYIQRYFTNIQCGVQSLFSPDFLVPHVSRIAGGFDRCLLLFRYSLNVHSRDVHPSYFVPRCPLQRCPPLLLGAALSTPAMSTPAFLTVPRCPLPRFQSPLRSVDDT